MELPRPAQAPKCLIPLHFSQAVHRTFSSAGHEGILPHYLPEGCGKCAQGRRGLGVMLHHLDRSCYWALWYYGSS